MLTEHAVREHAYALWEKAGRPAGEADRYWLQAERDLLALAAPRPKATRPRVAKAAEKAPAKTPRKLKAVA